MSGEEIPRQQPERDDGPEQYTRFIDPSKPLKNDRQEIYAQAVFDGAKKIDAYVLAGYSHDTSGASGLSEYPNVAARLEYLRANRAKEHNERRAKEYAAIIFTRDDAMRELEEARQLALRIERPASAVTATVAKAKVMGIISADEHGGRRPVVDMSIEELQDLNAELGTGISTIDKRIGQLEAAALGPGKLPN